MRVLLVAYHYPPDRAVGSLRATKIADAFLRRGHSVHVITARLPSDTVTTRPAPDRLTIRTVRLLPGPRQWWAWLKRRGNEGSGLKLATGGSPAPELRAPWWKRFLLSMIWTPDDRQGFILPAIVVSLREAWRADLIYSTAPPFSAHLASLLLHWLSRKRWVLELRDPWTANAWKPDNARTGFSDAIERWMERRCLRAAYRIVCVSEGIAEQVRKGLHGEDQVKLVVVRNGIDELLPPRGPRAPGQPLRIVHTGTFYFNRDPMPFLQALATLRESGCPPFVVHLVGNCRRYRGNSVEQAAAQLGLADVVTFQDWVPHEEGRRITREADLLLLLAQGQPAQIPNKLYEYLGTRIPILAFADEHGESAAMLQAVGGHIVVSEPRQETVDQAVMRAVNLACTGLGPGAETTLRDWTTEAQMERLTASLGPGWTPE